MESARAIQIVMPVNHAFQLQLEDLQGILKADNIKDRHCVIVSIAGAFRKGKSFLLNFFLKFLYAQYKKHDVTDWTCAGDNAKDLSRFASRGGRKPETTGIWMWSEIFTHDFENGEKVAIILLDTQGLFDNQSTTKECTATFAISMMLSSVQCYNVMQNIQEDDLQHLELFTEYGRLALQQTTDKPFQKLLFILRDWPYAKENPYGACQKVVDEVLAANMDQSDEMHQLRSRVKSSFDAIGAFLMPSPGKDIANGENINGDLKRIEPEFIENLKALVPSLFAPENLIVKKINGQKVRARDLIPYMQAYVGVFNSDKLPEPKSVLMATAETSNQILYNECLGLYLDTMHNQIEQKSKDEFEPYFIKCDLRSMHETARVAVQSQDARKLGGAEMIQAYMDKLESNMQMNFNKFDEENDKKKVDFDAMAEANIQVLHGDCVKIYTDSMQKVLDETETFVSLDGLHQLHEKTKHESLSKFHEAKKLGSQNLILDFQQKLETDIANKYIDFNQQNDKKKQQFEDLERAKAKATAEAEAKEMERKRADVEAARARAAEEAKVRAQQHADEQARLRAEADKSVSQLQAQIQGLREEIKEAKEDGILERVGGFIVGGILGGPVAAVAGAVMGKKVFDNIDKFNRNKSEKKENH